MCCYLRKADDKTYLCFLKCINRKILKDTQCTIILLTGLDQTFLKRFSRLSVLSIIACITLVMYKQFNFKIKIMKK